MAHIGMHKGKYPQLISIEHKNIEAPTQQTQRYRHTVNDTLYSARGPK